MNEKQKNRILILVIIFLALMLCAVSIWAFTKMPLAAGLAIKTATAPAGLLAPTQPAVTLPATQPVAATCGQSGSILLLVTAADMAQWDPPHTADFIRYVKIDFSQKLVTAVAIPRDLWVQTPTLASAGITAYRLGEVYYYEIKNGVGSQRDLMARATNVEAQTLYDNFGIVPNYYLTLDAGSVAPLVDALGGIDINNPAAILMDGYTFQAGTLHLNGQQASLYSRWMNVGTEWDRLARQKTVILEIWNKLLEPANLVKLPALIQQFSNSYVTDLTPELITSLSCMVDKVSEQQIFFTSISQDMVHAGPNDTMLPDVDRIRQFLQEQLVP